MQSYGWELDLSWRDRIANKVGYRIGFVLSDERTQVLSFPSNSTKLLSTLYDGMYTDDIWGYVTGGILQESDLVKVVGANNSVSYTFNGPRTAGSTYWPGYLWLRDLNGDGVINTGASTLENPGDRKLIGNSTARYRYGFTADLNYNGLDLNIFFQGIGKRDLWIDNSSYWGGNAGSRWMYERTWTPDRTDAKFPMYPTTPSEQTGYLINGAYLRLKQAVLGYTLPQQITKKAGIDKLRLSLSGYNLFDITDIPSVFDPEQISDAYPQRRSFSFGAQISF
jgi:hypothetical protein